MSKYNAVKTPVSNRGSIPEAFADDLVKWAVNAPGEIFAPKKDDPGETDIYTAVRPFLGPWDGLAHRRAVMLAVLSPLAGLESSWNWNEDYDKNNPDEDRPLTQSAGAFQVSPNSLYFGDDLKALVKNALGTLDPVSFREAMRSNIPLAIEYAARLIRHTIRANGPIKRGEINHFLNRDAVKEFQAAIAAAGPAPSVPAVPPPATTSPVDTGDKVDARSEANIATLHPRLQPIARQLVKDAAGAGITAKITSGTRTYDEQNELYAQGRTKAGKIVTNAKAGQSNHNFGIAMDLTVFDGAGPVWDGPQYKTLGALGKKLGLEWGGDWKTIDDQPHFQIRPGWSEGLSESQMLSALRLRHSDGRDVFA